MFLPCRRLRVLALLMSFSAKRYIPPGNHRVTLRQHGDREGQALAECLVALQPWEAQETENTGEICQAWASSYHVLVHLDSCHSRAVRRQKWSWQSGCETTIGRDKSHVLSYLCLFVAKAHVCRRA